jgi:hypothetical protein
MFPVATRFRLDGCQPRTLASLFEIYESSYRRLGQLLPHLVEARGDAVSRVAGALDLHLVVHERHRFTTDLTLTYRIQCPGEAPVPEPNLRIRVYHDARMAEAMSGRRRARHPHRHHCWRRPQPSDLEAKWELNRFLQRWLGYCLHQGHFFLPRDRSLPLASGSLR